MDKRRLLSADEAAEIVSLHPGTLRKLASQGRIRSFKVLNALRFLRGDVEALVVERPAHGGDWEPKAPDGN